MADGEKGFEKGFLGKRRIQTIETLTKKKPLFRRAGLEWQGRDLNDADERLTFKL